jgi:ribose transport system ATP-binding protein
VADLAIEAGIEDRIVELMLGGAAGPVAGSARKSLAAQTTPRLRVRGLATGTRLSNVSLDLAPGEVLGVVALEGQGQDELFDVLAGNRRATAGTVEVDGRAVSFRHPADAIALGLTLVPGDRAHALLMQRSVRENIALPLTARFGKWGGIAMRDESARVTAAIDRLQIDTRAQGEVRRLSGGNQQKVVLSKWLFTDPQVLILDEPTRGIDVGAKFEIYTIMNDLAAQGRGVVMISSEMPELLGMCDRIYVMNEGRIMGELTRAEASQERIMALILKNDGPGGRGSKSTEKVA